MAETSGNVSPLDLRLFLEGQEVPISGIQLSMNPNSPAMATIYGVPTPQAHRLLPRTLVHVFYMDASLPPDTAEEDRYRLLYSGEIIGFEYVKQPAVRSMAWKCMDSPSRHS